jgi:hypothetical protein
MYVSKQNLKKATTNNLNNFIAQNIPKNRLFVRAIIKHIYKAQYAADKCTQ